MKKPTLAKKLLLRLLLLVAGLLVLHLSLQYVNLSYNEKHGQVFEISNRLDMDDEASLPTWVSQVLLLVIFVTSLFARFLSKDKILRHAWLIVALTGLFFSLDEVAALHELVLQSVHLKVYGEAKPTLLLNAWLLLVPLIGIATGIFLYRLYKLVPRRTWYVIVGGWTIFLIGAIGFEVLANDVDHRKFLYQGVLTGAEETLEMVGTIFVLYGVVEYIESRYGAIIAKTAKQLKKDT